METVKNISIEPGSLVINFGEDCAYDANALHDALTKLPAEIYLQLYQKMQEKVSLARLAEQCCCEIRQTPPDGK